jgi:hypothetical protein
VNRGRGLLLPSRSGPCPAASRWLRDDAYYRHECSKRHRVEFSSTLEGAHDCKPGWILDDGAHHFAVRIVTRSRSGTVPLGGSHISS